MSKTVKQFEKELKQVPLPRMHQARLDLMEVMCQDQSELTHQVLNQHGKAMRFGLQQGELSTVQGRKKLFTHLGMFTTEASMVQP